jgi:beta-lactamase regulating signal transducer with metallopeptidase domain
VSGVLGPVLAVLWAAGLAVLVIRLFVGLAGAVRLTAEGTPLRDPAWRALLDRFLALVSLRRTVRLRSHPQVLVPLTWGWRNPVVLLPDGADGWTEDERSSALFHELSHIKRADFLVMLLVRASLALFWWNPLCWVVYRELLKEQEIACDELVLRAGIRPSAYAASLLAFRRAAGFRWNPSAALLGMLGRSSFQDRMAAILKQKLTFREVRMKTKIMVALVLVAAVAVIGSARPLAGRPAAEAAEGAMLIPMDVASAWAAEPQAQTQAEKAAVQRKAEEAEKAKQADKAKAAEKAKQAEKTIVIKPITVEGRPLEIVITEGAEVRTLKIDKPLTITTAKEGGALVLKIDGEEAKVLKGEPLRLEIKGGELALVKEGVPVEIIEGKKLGETEKIVTKDGVIYLKPRAEGGRAFTLAKTAEGGEAKVVIESRKEGEPVIVWSVTEPGKVKIAEGEAGGEVFVKTRKDIKPGETWVQAVPADKSHAGAVTVVKEGEPVTMAWSAKPAVGHALALRSQTEMLEKVRALQEQVQAIKAKKMDLAALEESLKKLEQELLENEEKVKAIGMKLDKIKLDGEPGTYTIVKKIGEAESQSKTDVWVYEKGDRAAAGRVMVSTGEKDDDAIHMIFTGHKGAEGKAAVEKAAAALKKALPEGYTIAEQKFDEEDGTIRFTIKGPEGKKEDGTLIRKIVDAVKDALKK